MTLVHGDFKPDNLLLPAVPQPQPQQQEDTQQEQEDPPQSDMREDTPQENSGAGGPVFETVPSCGVGVVDFQYCGGGYGSMDLAYFVCVGVSTAQLVGGDGVGAAVEAAEGEGEGAVKGTGRGMSAGEERLLRHYHQMHNASWLEWQDGPGAAASGCRDGPLLWGHLVLQYEAALLDWVRFMAGWGLWGSHSWAIHRAEGLVHPLDGLVVERRRTATWVAVAVSAGAPVGPPCAGAHEAESRANAGRICACCRHVLQLVIWVD